MLAWLRRGAYAAQLAGDRADLWPAGALAALAFLGWLPLLLVVAAPRAQDLSFVGVSLVTSGAFPANVIALSMALVGGFVLLCLLAAAAECALLRMAAAPSAPQPPFGAAAVGALAVILVAALPAMGAASAVVLGLTAVAPAVFTSPDVGTPVALRLAAAVWPLLAAFGVTVLLGQAFGGTALRRLLAADPPSVTAALAAAARQLLRRPWTRLGVALAGMLSDVLMVVITWALLRVLWAPIAVDLAEGRLASPESLLLLIGFVAIWLALLLAAGALHVAVSAWWVLEPAKADSVARAGAATSRPQARGGPST